MPKLSDTELFRIALADWKKENGFRDSITFSMLDRQSQAVIIQRAQHMKMQAQEKSA